MISLSGNISFSLSEICAVSTDHLRDPNTLQPDEVEKIEKQSLRVLFQAAVDFGFDAFDIFHQSTDEVKDVAEDITREMLDRLGGYQIQQRILGNVDYRKARYVILPDLLVRQALFVDSKAEQERRTATLQMSQISMRIRQMRGGNAVDEQGKLPMISEYRSLFYLTTILLAHYQYREEQNHHVLQTLTLVAVPNGRLQDFYNPSAADTIWLVGRNADTRGEDFRVRLAFERLETKAAWRIQRLNYNPTARQVEYAWKE
jgi:hypothetical protein